MCIHSCAAFARELWEGRRWVCRWVCAFVRVPLMCVGALETDEFGPIRSRACLGKRWARGRAWRAGLNAPCHRVEE